MEKTNSKAAPIRKFEKVIEIIEKNNYEKNRMIPILQQVQEEYRYLPEDILTFISTALKVSPAEVYGVATFYSHFALEPKGKYIIKICNGTACHVKSSMKIYDAIAEELSLSESKTTSDDMLFTLETVSCLGACGLAPVIVINDEVYGQVTPEKSVEIIRSIKSREDCK